MLIPKLDIARVEMHAAEWKVHGEEAARLKMEARKLKERLVHVQNKQEPLNDLQE